MIHQPLGGGQGQATDISIMANRLLKVKKRLNSILATNTNKSLDLIENDTERDHFLDAEEALEYGIIDKIIE
jgi:ATP-dependent Clp protease protease subunit